MADNSVDSIVTDPPYGLSFMGKKWDYDVPSVEIWRECLRVLKPGGHLLSFAGTRTQHRMAVRIEDAGFEIRDMIAWLYGSGFPKSHDVSKAIDKAAGAEREVVGVKKSPDGRNYSIESAVNRGEFGGESAFKKSGMNTEKLILTAPSTEDAIKWQGWGTALKPALEPITVARKPLSESTVVKNVLKWGTGGVNVDGCRVDAAARGRFPANLILDEEAGAMLDAQSGAQASRFFYCAKASKSERNAGLDSSLLVWEKEQWENADLSSLTENINQLSKDISVEILTDDKPWSTDIYGHSISEQYPKGMTFTIETVLKLIIGLKTSNASQSSNTNEDIRDAIKTIEANGLSLAESVLFTNQWSLNTTSEKTASLLGVVRAALPMLLQIRGFAKSGNFHSTVKPLALMRYLCRLVTPPGGTVLDPFMGSGSTGIAAIKEGFCFIGIEREQEYLTIAEARIASALKETE